MPALKHGTVSGRRAGGKKTQESGVFLVEGNCCIMQSRASAAPSLFRGHEDSLRCHVTEGAEQTSNARGVCGSTAQKLQLRPSGSAGVTAPRSPLVLGIVVFFKNFFNLGWNGETRDPASHEQMVQN